MTEYTIPYARFLLRSWGFTRKVPMGRHVKRASRQKIAWFRKKLGPLIEGRMRAGYTVCVQDEAICVADARLRKGVYTHKGVRGVYSVRHKDPELMSHLLAYRSPELPG